jgi:IS4 transposase
MAKFDGAKIQETLHKLLPGDWIEEKARELGAVHRNRKVEVDALVWSLVLGFATSSRKRFIASTRRAYQLATKTTIAASSFYDRFTPGLVALLQSCLEKAMSQTSEPVRALTGLLKDFKDLVVTDSSILRLSTLLAGVFPGARTNHSPAAAKVHIVTSVVAQGPRTIKITTGRSADGPALVVGPWVKGRLLLFDLGYFCYHAFVRIAELGGYFISRLKENADPVIVGEHITHGVQGLVGSRLRDVLHMFTGQFIDLQVRVKFWRRSYRGRKRADEYSFRLVGVWNDATHRYHLYMTNVASSLLTPADVAQTYRFRWEIELLFKELKSYFHLEDLASANEYVVRALIFSALLTGIVARTLQALASAVLPRGKRIPHGRFAAVFASVAQRILEFLTNPELLHPDEIRHLVTFILKESVDPNMSRRLLSTSFGG